LTTKNPVVSALLAALLTAAVLIAITLATTHGQLILIPYAVAAIAMAFHARNESFARSFAAVFATLFIASVLLHAYLTLAVRTAPISLAGHASRMAAVAAIASIASATAVLIARRAASPPSASPAPRR
jgi:predicted membrane protein